MRLGSKRNQDMKGGKCNSVRLMRARTANIKVRDKLVMTDLIPLNDVGG